METLLVSGGAHLVPARGTAGQPTLPAASPAATVAL
jgi:hypothetical protein